MQMCEGLALLVMICGGIDQSMRCSGFPLFGSWVVDCGALPVLPVAGPMQHFSLAGLYHGKACIRPSRGLGGTSQH